MLVSLVLEALWRDLIIQMCPHIFFPVPFGNVSHSAGWKAVGSSHFNIAFTFSIWFPAMLKLSIGGGLGISVAVISSSWWGYSKFLQPRTGPPSWADLRIFPVVGLIGPLISSRSKISVKLGDCMWMDVRGVWFFFVVLHGFWMFWSQGLAHELTGNIPGSRLSWLVSLSPCQVAENWCTHKKWLERSHDKP